MGQHYFDSRTFNYTRERPDGIPKDFPNPEQIFVLMDVFHSKGGSFQRLLDCGGIRYLLLLEFNKDVNNCMENTLLENMYQGFEAAQKDINRCRRSLTLFSKECMKSFWPYLNEDFQMRCKNATLMAPIGPFGFGRKHTHKIQLKTIHGSVCAMEHDTVFEANSEYFDNPHPDLRCFSRNEVEILEMITMDIFRVRIQDGEYVLKEGRYGIMRAVGKLHGVVYPNVLSLKGAVVDAEGNIMGMLTPFIPGPLLGDITSATTPQKEKWKTEISDTMDFLHKENIVWGDAKPENIIINSATDEPVLIDFDGGYSEGWVDRDLCNTLEGDLQALPRILKFVDNIPTSEI